MTALCDGTHLQSLVAAAGLTMTKITQLEDRGAAVAWSPVASHADFLALGAKVCIFVATCFGYLGRWTKTR
jgi:hypothetical protein